MPRPDVRAELEAIAAGKAPARESERTIIPERMLEKHQPDFRAWLAFAQASRSQEGEPLHAPAELLTPLP